MKTKLLENDKYMSYLAISEISKKKTLIIVQNIGMKISKNINVIHVKGRKVIMIFL